jgi:Zn finger protein HypA/HybF involved in hydrogenase expression
MPTNHQLNIYDLDNSAECQCCKHQDETENYVIRCPSEKRCTVYIEMAPRLEYFSQQTAHKHRNEALHH